MDSGQTVFFGVRGVDPYKDEASYEAVYEIFDLFLFRKRRITEEVEKAILDHSGPYFEDPISAKKHARNNGLKNSRIVNTDEGYFALNESDISTFSNEHELAKEVKQMIQDLGGSGIRFVEEGSEEN